MRNSHARLTKLHARAEALHRDIVHDLLGPAGDDPPLAVRQVGELSERLAKSLMTCLSVMVIEADPELRRSLDPMRKEKAA